MMIVKKEDKQLYDFLKDAFNIMGRSNSEKYLLGDKGTLYFSTFYIKGSISIKMLAEKNGKMEEVDKNSFGTSFYTLKMRDDKSFELKEDSTIVKEEEHASVKVNTAELFKGHEYVRKLENIRTTLISTITNDTGVFVPDRFLGLISKMGECDVYVKDNKIMCMKEKNIEKEKLSVKTCLLFVCDHDQPGGFNDAETRMQKM